MWSNGGNFTPVTSGPDLSHDTGFFIYLGPVNKLATTQLVNGVRVTIPIYTPDSDADYTNYVDFRSIDVDDSIKMKSDSMSLTIVIKDRAIKKPKSGQQIELRNYKSDGFWFEFAGIIESVRERQVNPTTYAYEVSCADWTRLFNRLVVREDWVAGTMSKTLVQALVDGYCSNDGFTANHIEVNVPLPAMLFDFVEPTAAMDEIAEAADAQWFVDFEKDVHLFREESYSAPVPLIEWLPNSTQHMTDLYDLEIEENISQVKNTIWYKDALVEGKDNVVSTYYTQGTEVKTTTPIFVPTTAVDWSTWITAIIKNRTTGATVRNLTTVKRLHTDGEPSVGDGANTIWADIDNGVLVLPPGNGIASTDYLEVTHKPVQAQPDSYRNQDSVNWLQAREGGSGQYEYVISKPMLVEEEELSASFSRFNKRAGMPLITGNFKSRVERWAAGQSFNLRSPVRGPEDTYWTSDVLYIISVRKRFLSKDILEHEISFSSNIYTD